MNRKTQDWSKVGPIVAMTWLAACSTPTCGAGGFASDGGRVGPGQAAGPGRVGHEEADVYERMREAMVVSQIIARDVRDREVLRAMRAVPRHLFVPEGMRDHAYEDRALPIGYHQTISQPYVVAAMTEALRGERGMKVLEIGTGSGYQAAILAELGLRVWSIEIVPELARSARERLRRLGYASVTVIEGDGYAGWPPEAPYDRIIVTAAPPDVPQALRDQLAVGGRMVLPVGDLDQDLIVLEKTADGFVRSVLFPVRFVPMVHGAGE